MYALFRLRKDLELFANLRPVRPLPALAGASSIKRAVLRGVDLLVVRELTGGIYYGQPSAITEGPGGAARRRSIRWPTPRRRSSAFCAMPSSWRSGRRRQLTSVDKANVLSCSLLWRRVADRVATDYPDVTLRHMLVDACSMALIRQPAEFDVIVTENMFGDILTDEASMLAGSLGMLPSASLGTRHTRIGPVRPLRADSRHGARYRRAGQGESAGGDSERGDAAAPFAGTSGRRGRWRRAVAAVMRRAIAPPISPRRAAPSSRHGEMGAAVAGSVSERSSG